MKDIECTLIKIDPDREALVWVKTRNNEGFNIAWFWSVRGKLVLEKPLEA